MEMRARITHVLTEPHAVKQSGVVSKRLLRKPRRRAAAVMLTTTRLSFCRRCAARYKLRWRRWKMMRWFGG